jgi:hypothetical protein
MTGREICMSVFKDGDWVKWTSGAGGQLLEKRGEIALVLRPMEPALPRVKVVASEYRAGEVLRMIGRGAGHRKEASYLVAVWMGPRGKKQLYWPLATKLTLLNEDERHEAEEESKGAQGVVEEEKEEVQSGEEAADKESEAKGKTESGEA